MTTDNDQHRWQHKRWFAAYVSAIEALAAGGLALHLILIALALFK